MRKIYLTVIALSVIAFPLFADNMKDAYQQALERNYEQAIELYKKAYKQSEGISHGGLAAMWVGFLNEQGGHGIKKDLDEAIVWYKKAIDKTHYVAYGKLGSLYSSKLNSTHYDKQKAISCAENLIDKRCNKFSAHSDAAEIYYRIGDYKRAEEHQIMAIKIAEDSGLHSKKSMEREKRALTKYREKMQ